MLFAKPTIFKITFALSLFIALSAKAQTPDETTAAKTSYFKFALSYLSNSVYYGRKDSLVIPYIIPAISYHDKSGFYFEGSLSYLAGTGAQVDAGAITAGYNFSGKNENVSGEIYASKYFTNNSSYSVKGDVKGAAGGLLDYNTGPLSVSGGADASFSSKLDVAINFGLSHFFEFGENKNWTITPSALVNAGTQNFYQNYFTDRKYSLKRKRRVTQNSNAVKVIVMSKKFSILDYELLLPVGFDSNKWGVFFTPTFSIPVNGFTYSLNNGQTYQSEHLSNTLYAEVGAYIKF